MCIRPDESGNLLNKGDGMFELIRQYMYQRSQKNKANRLIAMRLHATLVDKERDSRGQDINTESTKKAIFINRFWR